MSDAKRQAIEAISSLPDDTDPQEIINFLYRVYRIQRGISSRSEGAPAPAPLVPAGSRSIKESFGLLHRDGQPAMSVADMDEAIARAVEDENRDDRR